MKKPELATGDVKNHGSGAETHAASEAQSNVAVRHSTRCEHPTARTCLPLAQCLRRSDISEKLTTVKEETYYEGLLVSMYAFDGL